MRAIKNVYILREARMAIWIELLLLGCLRWVGDDAMHARAAGDNHIWPDRLVWIFGWDLENDAHWQSVQDLLRRANKACYNGVVLSAGLDALCKKSNKFVERLRAMEKLSAELGLELIPSIFSIGYAGGLLAHNPHLAEGLPVRDARFKVDEFGQTAIFEPEDQAQIVNGDFEDHQGNLFRAFQFHDQPGVVSFADTNVYHSGLCSIRFENFAANKWGHGRIMQEVTVKPFSFYRVSAWIKTQGLIPSSAFQILVLTEQREIAPRRISIEPTTDWKEVVTFFNSYTNRLVRIYIGVWGAQAGRLWIDDLQIRPMGPVNILRRRGTPVSVASEDGSYVYAEGLDYERFVDPRFSLYQPDHTPAMLKILPGSRIRPGQVLRVSWYHPMIIYSSQVTACMAEPEVYQIWEHEAELLARCVRARRFLLSMDEIRMGGTCEACRDKEMAVLLGQCVTKGVEILRRHFPGAQVAIWSDMLDPNHNARANYYLVDGDFRGSWRYVPRDLIIAVWGGKPRPESLTFFSKEGFQTFVACYYDEADLQNVKKWVEAARQTPGVRGFMYTTWERKYQLLEDFASVAWGELFNPK